MNATEENERKMQTTSDEDARRRMKEWMSSEE